MNAYSQDLRNKVIALHKTNTHSKLELSELFSIGYATIKRWCQEYKLTGKSIDNNISKIRGWAQKGFKSFTEALGFRTNRSTLIAGYNY